MKTRSIIILCASLALASCTWPYGQSTDQFRIAQGYAMQQQQEAHRAASLSTASQGLRNLAPNAAPMVPFTPFRPFNQ